jgi:hypothetical protein
VRDFDLKMKRALFRDMAEQGANPVGIFLGICIPPAQKIIGRAISTVVANADD